MKFLLSYKLFEEATLFDLAKKIDHPDVLKQVDDIKNDDSNLVSNITLSSRYNNKKVRFNISYNHTVTHDLIDKFNKRANTQSVKQINNTLKHGFNEIYPQYLNTVNLKGDKTTKKFSIFFENSLDKYNNGFSVVYSIKSDEVKKGVYLYNVFIITILKNEAYISDKNFTINY